MTPQELTEKLAKEFESHHPQTSLDVAAIAVNMFWPLVEDFKHNRNLALDLVRKLDMNKSLSARIERTRFSIDTFDALSNLKGAKQ